MTTNRKEELIRSYIAAYNAKDIAAMLEGLTVDIHFENHSGGEMNMSLDGIEAFRSQAEQAASLFTEREQEISGIRHLTHETEVTILYKAILAMDLPNGLKKGNALTLAGRSLFSFSGDKINSITDIS